MAMKTKLNCPVCARPEISGDICPNCETNLSLIRMLTELPVAEPTAATAKPQRPGISTWLLAGAAICLLVVGIALGGVSYAFFIEQTNPGLKHREGSLQVSEVVFIPNRPESCP